MNNSISNIELYSKAGHHNSIHAKELVFSKETRDKMRIAKQGCIPWNKGLTKQTDKRIIKNSEAMTIERS